MDHKNPLNLSDLDAAVYLRKSRMEEGLATDEVLAKHQKTLYGYAAGHGIHILEEYPEVVSGESLYARPQMLRLLQDVEDGKYDAVLCMDLDRLSRGRMKDQGIILDAFRESGTLIITPEKIYNLSDEIDEEYAELKTFISRREYKIITKRLRRGLQMSIQDGCYVANAPYGYRKTVVDRKPTLEIYEPEAKFVRMMFELYAKGYGCVAVARHINALGAKPHRSEEFSRNSVAKILRNPTYIGKIVWNQKKHIRKGAQIPVQITLTNLGTQPMTELTVDIGGNTVQTAQNLSLAPGQSLTFTVSARNPAAETDGVRNQAASDATLTYSVRNLPEGAAFDAATHTFSWTPDLTGDYTVTFIADDGVRPVETDVTIHVDGTLWQKAHSAIQRIFL